MALTKFGRETHKQQLTMGKIRQVPSAAGALSALNSCRFTTKQDEDDGEEDAFAACMWRGMMTSSRTQTVCWMYKVLACVHVLSSYILCAHANRRRIIRGQRLFHSAPLIVRRLFQGGVYSRTASFHGNTVVTGAAIRDKNRSQHLQLTPNHT